VKEGDEKISNETPGGSTVLMSAAVSAAYRNETSADVPRNLENEILRRGLLLATGQMGLGPPGILAQ
jgi:hypothetical protein